MKSESRSAARAIAPVLAILALAFTGLRCSDTIGELCPAGSFQAGLFTTTLAFNAADTSQCYYSNDGGPLDASLAVTGADAGPDTFSAAICSGLNPDGGASLFYFALISEVRAAPLANGVFTYSDPAPSTVIGTSCGCNIAVNETISFNVVPTTAGTPVAINIDGGLPPIASFNGTVVDQIADGDDAGVNCSCNLPCDLQYTITGTAL